MSGIGDGIVSIFNALGTLLSDFGRALLGGRSLEAKRNETVASYQGMMGNLLETLGNTQGGINVLIVKRDAVARNLKAQERDYNLAVRALKGKTGTALDEAKRQVILQTKLITSTKALLGTLDGQVARMKANQAAADARTMDVRIRQAEATSEADALVIQGDFARMRKEIAKGQLAAAGIIKGAGVTDRRGEMREDVARIEGQAESWERQAGMMLGSTGVAEEVTYDELDDTERETLEAAFKQAGMEIPPRPEAVEVTENAEQQ